MSLSGVVQKGSLQGISSFQGENESIWESNVSLIFLATELIDLHSYPESWKSQKATFPGGEDRFKNYNIVTAHLQN